MSFDFVGVAEAAYAPADDDVAWLRGLVAAAEPAFAGACGFVALCFEAPNGDPSRLKALVSTSPSTERLHEDLRMTWQANPDFFWRQMRANVCGSVSQTAPAFYPALLTRNQPFGVEDAIFIKGLDPSCDGCVLVAVMPERTALPPADAGNWGRVAAHIAAGYRLRNRPPTAEAILRTSGSVVHAEEPAKSNATRALLRESALALGRARGALRRRDPARALAVWRALVAARWTLVDHIDTDGKHQLVARRNDADAPGLAALTARERQVVGHACSGHSNKLIAYELGISPSTVGVLLWRAIRKLGYRSRAELVASVLAGSTQ